MLSMNPRVPLFLALVAGMAMVGATAWQGYVFWQNESPQATQSNRVTARHIAEKPSVPALSLASLELFGSPQESGDEPVANTEDLPETNLRLFLRGVLAADGDFPGSALIEDDKSKTEVFLIGDELPGNARLRSVHPNRVVLDRGGKLENLYFPETDNRSGISFSSDADNIQQASPQPQSPAVSNRTAPSGPPANEQERREEIRKRLEQLRERLRTNG